MLYSIFFLFVLEYTTVEPVRVRTPVQRPETGQPVQQPGVRYIPHQAVQYWYN